MPGGRLTDAHLLPARLQILAQREGRAAATLRMDLACLPCLAMDCTLLPGEIEMHSGNIRIFCFRLETRTAATCCAAWELGFAVPFQGSRVLVHLFVELPFTPPAGAEVFLPPPLH